MCAAQIPFKVTVSCASNSKPLLRHETAEILRSRRQQHIRKACGVQNYWNDVSCPTVTRFLHAVTLAL